MVYLGEPAGYVVRLEDGMTIYFAGDTSIFGDMRLIGEIYRPEIAFLPIGDRFTMGPDTAARACEMLGVRQVVPMHWGAFQLTDESLNEPIERFRRAWDARLPAARLHVLAVGETVSIP